MSDEGQVQEASSSLSDPYVKETILPSRGLLYDDKVPGGLVKVRPMKTSEEKMVFGGGKDRNSVMDNIIQNCLLTKDWPFNEYLVGDKYYLLMFVRGITYGFNYSFTVRCPECGEAFKQDLKLPEGLKVRVMEDSDASEPYEIVLPSSGKVVKLRLLRVFDEKAAGKYAAAQRKKSVQEGDPSYTFLLSKHIVSVDGKEVDASRALSFCEDLYGPDSQAIRDCIDEHSPGADLQLDIECPACFNDFESVMPFTSQFFRPKRS